MRRKPQGRQADASPAAPASPPRRDERPCQGPARAPRRLRSVDEHVMAWCAAAAEAALDGADSAAAAAAAAAARRHRAPGGASGSDASSPRGGGARGGERDAEPAIYGSNHFRIHCYKVVACDRRTPHEWKSCPFVHPGEHGRRRPLTVARYDAVMCSHARRGESCPAGDACTKSHNVFEMWLHPDRYRTQICIQGTACNRQICFFAHTPEELRRPPCKSPHAADGASRRASSAGGGGAAAVSTTAATSTAGGSRRDQGRAPSSASGASGAARDAPPRAPRLSIPATRSGEWPAAAAAALGLSPPQQAAPSEFEGAFSAATSAVAAVAAAGGTAADEERAAFAAARAQVERQRRAAAAAAAAAAASTAQAMAALGADASAWALLNGPHAAAAVAAVTAGLRSGPLPLPPPHHGGGRGPPPGALSAPLPRLDSAGGAAGGRCSAQGPPSGPLRAPYSAYVLPPLPPPGPELLAMLYGSQPPSGPLPGADAPRGAGRAGPDVWCAPPPDDGMWQTVRGSTVWDDRMRSGCGFAGLLASGPSLLSAPIGGLHLQVGPLGRGPEGPDLASEPLPTWPPAGVAFGGRGGAFGGWADAGCGV